MRHVDTAASASRNGVANPNENPAPLNITNAVTSTCSTTSQAPRPFLERGWDDGRKR